NLATRTRLLTEDEKGSRMAFRHTANHQHFSVYTAAQTGPTVRFRVEGQRITVQSDEGAIDFTRTLTLDDRGCCRLRVGTEDLDEWQVLKRALELFLFPV